jgi:hypothetical protein
MILPGVVASMVPRGIAPDTTYITDAYIASDLALADAAAVTSWAPRIGADPLTGSAVMRIESGKKMVRHTDHILNIPARTIGAGMSQFVCIRLNQPRGTFTAGGSSSYFQLAFDRYRAYMVRAREAGITDSGLAEIGGGVDFAIVEITTNNSNQHRIAINNVVVANSTTSTGFSYPQYYGKNSGLDLAPMGADVAGVAFVANKFLSVDEASGIHAWLAQECEAHLTPRPANVGWRLEVTKRRDNATTWTQLAAMELRNMAYVAPTNQQTGGTAFASSDYGGYPGSSAFDANAGTFSNSNGTLPYQLGYQHPAPISCLSVTLTARGDGFGPDAAPKNFNVRYSDDGVTYTTAWSVTDSGTWTAGGTKSFNAPDGAAYGTHAYWKLDIVSPVAGSYVSVAELRFNAIRVAINLSTNASGAATASSYHAEWYDQWVPSRAFDEGAASVWISQQATPMPQWLQFNASAAISPAVLFLQPAAADDAAAPQDFKLKKWNGSTWVDVLTVTGQTSWPANGVEFAIP